MKKRNKIILCICSILVIMASIFSFIPLNNDRYEVSADEVVTDVSYVTSDFPIIQYNYICNWSSSSRQLVSNNNTNYNIWYPRYTFSTIDGVLYLSFNKLLCVDYNNSVDFLSLDVSIFYLANDGVYLVGDTLNVYNYPTGSRFIYALTDDYSSSQGLLTSTYNFVFDISYTNFAVDLSTINRLLIDKGNSGNPISNLGYYNYFNYSDVSSNFISMNIPFFTSIPSGVSLNDFFLNRRIYYFSNAYDFSNNEYYNQGFSAGQSQGYNQGFTSGKSQGYSDGYNNGKNFGYNEGYNEGLNDSNQYTFLNLISATIDAPMSYFQSLFNFELLGVNLQGFLLALFTLCVIVTIIKLCIGR